MLSNEHGSVSADELSRATCTVMQNLTGPYGLLWHKRYNALNNSMIPLPVELQNTTKVLRVGRRRIDWLLDQIRTVYGVWIHPDILLVLQKIETTERPKKVSYVKIFADDIGYDYGVYDSFLLHLESHPMYKPCTQEDILYLWIDALITETSINAGIAAQPIFDGTHGNVFRFSDHGLFDEEKNKIRTMVNNLHLECRSHEWYVRLR